MEEKKMEGIEALWSVQFRSNLGILGSGVVVFETEKIFGGDAKFYYLGTFKISPDGRVEADVEVNHYSGDTLSILGHRKHFKLKVSGIRNVPQMDLHGFDKQNPSLKIQMILNKIADLP